MRVAVVGATSWGCTLASLLERRGAEVSLVCRDASEARAVAADRGVARLPELTLPPPVEVVGADVRVAAEGVVIAVPAQSVRVTLAPMRWAGSPRVLCASKGIERSTLLRMSEVIAEVAAGVGNISALSGPNLAHEVVRGLPAAAVVASEDASEADWWQEALSGPTFRVYTSTDVVGVEAGGALKNVIAIAAGATAGLGFGTNAVAAVMTRGLAEITRLGVAMGADPLTFQGLAGVGDLAATCFSNLSRNRRLGELLAAGHPPAEALALLGEVAEGAATAPAALSLARRHQVELPIAEQVAAVMQGEASVGEAMTRLLSRSAKPERPA